jgi:tryptophan synthase alpha chain
MTIKELFAEREEPLLNIYFTAGFPQLDSMFEIMAGLEEAGVDMVEIGMPYSDPLSDGPTIQNSNAIAIKNGITTDLIFEQLSHCSSKIPKIMMGYFNAVFQYGVERFCEKCKINGVSGIILPDLPLDIYQEKYQSIFEQHEIDPIFLITPETSEKRIKYIDQQSNAFIYAVSSSSTTGKETGIQSAKAYLNRLKKMNLKNPIMVGFNISSKADFDFVSQYAAGGIIGSAFINQIATSKSVRKDTRSFIQSIRAKN